MNRRGFFKALASVAVVAVTPIKFIAPVLHERIVSSLTFEEIISTTLKTRMPEIAANIYSENQLLKKLMEKR